LWRWRNGRACCCGTTHFSLDTAAPPRLNQRMRPTHRDGAAGAVHGSAAAAAAGTPTSVLARACRLLAALDADHPQLSISELARRTRLPKSTTHRLAQELVGLGLLETAAEGGVQLGLRLFELGELVPLRRSLRDAALPFMEDLVQATRQRVHLAVLEGTEVVYLQILGTRSPIVVPSRTGGRLPAHATGVGKAMLAFAPTAVVQARIEAGLTRVSGRSITNAGVLARELTTIRKEGVAYDREESRLGVSCAAAPVFGPDGVVVAALSVTGRTGQVDVERLAPAVKTAALALSRRLGHHPGR
jgi:IclR family transcriptional regulator, acetate operon repressor